MSPREGFLLHKIGALRAAVKGDGAWPDRVLVPTSNLFIKHNSGTVILGSAVSVNPNDKTITLQDGGVLKWDILVIATGSVSNSPGEPPLSITTVEGTKQYFKQFSTDVKQAKSVLIVGAGPVGLELAGEIRETFGKQIEITCLSRAQEILQGTTPLPAGGVRSMKRLVEQQGVKLVLNDELLELPVEHGWIKPPANGGGSVVLKSGKTLACDLIVFANGVKVTSQYLPVEWLDAESREVEIDAETFRVKGRYDVFAAGDVAKTGFSKLGYIAMADSPALTKNILEALDKKAPSHRVTRAKTTGMLVSFGAHKGRAMLPFITLGNFLSRQVKTKDMFTAMVWDSVNADRKKLPKAE